jgi:regulator of protease activity HflC (stomatin/prohibitin superfamily)
MLNLAVALDEAAALLEQGDAPAAIARLEALPAAEGDELRRHDLLAAAYSSVQRDDLALRHYLPDFWTPTLSSPTWSSLLVV